MRSFTDNRSHLLVLATGEELHESLQVYATDTGMRSAAVQAIGSASSVELGFYIPDMREYHWQTFVESLEIINLTGNLSIVDGQPFWHIHGTFGKSDYQTIAGHVRRLVVGMTCELVITPIDVNVTRRYDDETGLKLLTAADN